jgi:dolichyl-phosphate-mannose-protein mannosyltransferase
MSRAERVPGVALAIASAVGFGARLYAAVRVGFGDSEALYASYALHPAPAYLDHPGLIGLFARAVGDGSAPSPVWAHRVTAVLATLAPLAIVLSARALRANWGGALAAGLVTAVVPEVAIGLFAMTPDLLLFLMWTAALGLAAAGLLATPSSVRASACLVMAGLAAGVGLASKASAAGLVLALVLTYASKHARAHARTPWPWAGLALGALVVFPIGAYEARTGWPMMRHRLIATQADAGVSFRNLGALVGGQLAYLSPIVAFLAALVAWDLWKAKKESPVATLLANALVAPLVLLVPLSLWSKVAEPHWVAPALLALPLWYAVREDPPWGGVQVPRGLVRAGVVLAAAMSLAVHAWVLLPGLASIVPERTYDGRVDISNELYGWPEVLDSVRELAKRHRSGSPDREDIVLVGPHWVVSAQLEAALGREFPVGCAGPEAADFASWNPRARWDGADLVLFVTDNRFQATSRALFPQRVRIDARTLEVYRGGHLARTFTIEVLAARDVG